jgi:minor curlin subunit
MKLTALLSLAICLIAETAKAQLAEPTTISREQQLVETVGLERLPNGAPLPTLGSLQNVTGLQQNGNGNTARIDQQTLASPANQAYVAQIGEANILGLSQVGGNNRLYVIQNGNGNNAGYTQNGQNNSTTITQNGSQNKIGGVAAGSNMVLEGDNTTMKITQNGDNNVVKGDVRESNRNYEIIQSGRDNTLTQIESTMQTPKGYTVEMRGQGINITIEQSKVLPGVR